MGVGANHPGVHQGRAPARAAPGRRLLHHQQARQGIAAVDLANEQIRERADELRDAAPGRLELHGHGDRVAVVLDEVENRQAPVGRRVQALPELALGRRPLTGGAVHDIVSMGGKRGGRYAGLRTAHGLQELRPRGRRLRDEVEPGMPPVGRHLAPPGVRILARARGAEEHLERGHAELQGEGPVPVVRVEPVVARPEHHARGYQDRLVARSADLEVDLVLALELYLLVVELAREIHGPVDAQQGLAVEPLQLVDGLCGQAPSSRRRILLHYGEGASSARLAE